MQRFFIIIMATGLVVLTVILIALVVPKHNPKDPAPHRALFSSGVVLTGRFSP